MRQMAVASFPVAAYSLQEFASIFDVGDDMYVLNAPGSETPFERMTYADFLGDNAGAVASIAPGPWITIRTFAGKFQRSLTMLCNRGVFTRPDDAKEVFDAVQRGLDQIAADEAELKRIRALANQSFDEWVAYKPGRY